MKKLLSFFAYAIFLVSFNIQAIEITQHMTGSWYNRDQEGHGFNIEVIGPNKSVFYWYVYNPDGTPTWLVGRGPHVDGRIEGVAYHNTGMRWGVFDPLERTQERWGTVTIDFIGCDSAQVSYQSDDPSEKAIPYGSGSFEISRITYVHKSKCQETPYPGIYKGTFWSETLDEGFPATVLLNIHGDVIVFVMDHKSFFGMYTVNSPLFSGSGQVYANDTRQLYGESFQFEGQIKEEYRLFAESSIPGVDQGFFDVHPITQFYFRGLTTADLAGDYEMEDLHSFNEGTATITADGTITGTDATGCNWSGEILVGDTAFNLFQINLSVTDCDDDHGMSYWGMGFQDDAENLEDGLALWIFTHDGQVTKSAFLTRMP
ncbi:MAG: hypothetical protein OQJ84_05170 [Xanthomonadales bacterium]|nr:hypothetical protein [Xanthomonadales bacterium]